MIDINDLNNKQKEAVTEQIKPILVVAGAGSGKTRVLTMRIGYLIEHFNIKPSRILAITFTNKAANEMRVRIGKILNGTHVSWVGTYHGTCLKILKEEYANVGLCEKFSILDEEDKLLLIKDIYRAGGVDMKILKPNKMIGIISTIKNSAINVNEIRDIKDAKIFSIYSQEELNVVKYVYVLYKEKMLGASLLDFDDLLIFVHKLFKTKPEIAQKWSNRFDYILVDEFQDTNKLQFEILNSLINKEKHNIFAVGDPDQTIYKWRGAYANIFKDYLKFYPDTKTIILDTNYRSTKKILIAANSIIKHNTDRIKKDLITPNAIGDDVFYYNGADDYDEASYVSRKIKQFINTNTFQPCQIVILYRANYLSRPFEQELINNSIPYYIYGGLKFYQRMEIKDLLAYLKILSIPDEVSVKRVINVPKRNIGESTIDKVNKHALNKGISFLDALQLNDLVDWNTKNISLFFNLIEDIKSKIIGKSIAETVQIIFDEIKYSEYIDLIESEIDKANDRKQNIKELINSIKEFESKNPNTTISDYLQEISLYTEANDNTNNKNDSVILMTVHAAKGTEYPVVFIVGMNEKIFPTIRMGESPDIEEERRIAYVAITRAEQKLFLTSNTGFSFISNNYNTPSRFINEIGTNNFVRDKKIMDTISSANLEWYNSTKPVDYSKNFEEKDVNINIGDTISHITFGEGLVVGCNGDYIDIKFKKSNGIKTLIKNHIGIKRILK